MNTLPPILIDSREQAPLSFPGYETRRVALDAGDYSLGGMTELIAVERKSLPDLCGSCANSARNRFKRELHRMKAYRCKAVVVEATLEDAIRGRYRSQLHPNALLASVSSWQLRYSIPFIWAGDPKGAARITLELLKQFYRQCVEFAKTLAVA